MADTVFNIAKGRVVEYVNRVDANDPAAATLVVCALLTTGLEADGTLQDADTFAAVIAGATNEATNTGYARKVITDTAVALGTPDDTNNRFDVDIADQTWTAVATSPGAWSRLVICYDPSSSGVTDAVMIPLTLHDFVVTPDGSDITAVIAAAGFFRAS